MAIYNKKKFTKGDVISPTKLADKLNESMGISSTDSSVKLYLVGATTQSNNAETHSDTSVYATDGALHANKLEIGYEGTAYGQNSIAHTMSYGINGISVGSSYLWSADSYTVSTSQSTLTNNIKEGTVLKFPDSVLRCVTNINGTTFTVDKKLTTTDSSATLYKLWGISYGEYSCARGQGSTSSGAYSHAEGYQTTAYGHYSHAEGNYTVASGSSSHAEGSNTVTNNFAEHAQGIYNVSNTGTVDASKTLISIGIGTAENARANAVEVMYDGSVYIKGLGGYTGSSISSSTKSLKSVIDGKLNTTGGTVSGTVAYTINELSPLDASIDFGKKYNVVSVNRALPSNTLELTLNDSISIILFSSIGTVFEVTCTVINRLSNNINIVFPTSSISSLKITNMIGVPNIVLGPDKVGEFVFTLYSLSPNKAMVTFNGGVES